MKFSISRILNTIVIVLFVAGCSSMPDYNNNPDDQRSRRDGAIEELNKNTN